MKSAGQLTECKQPTMTIRHLINNTDRDKLQNFVTLPILIICSLYRCSLLSARWLGYVHLT